MIRLFTMDKAPSSRSATFNKMNYITQRAQQNLDRALKVHRFASRAVPSNHPLVTLINTMNLPLTASKERYIELADASFEPVVAALGIGSGVAPSKIDNAGWFYGTPEILFAYIDQDFRSALPKWFDISPIKVFHHDRTDISYVLLNGSPNTKETNTAIIGIDVGKLMLMYRGWRHWQRAVNPDAQQTIPQFIATWVLPSMIMSHNNVAWRNNILAQINGTPIAKTLQREPATVINNTQYIEEVASEIVLRIADTKAQYHDQLNTIPMLYGDHGWDDSRQPDFSFSRYGNLCKMFTTMSWMHLLLKIADMSDGRANTGVDTDLHRFLERYRSGRWANRGSIKIFVDSFVEERLAPYIKV